MSTETAKGKFISLPNYVTQENEEKYQDQLFPTLTMTDLKENIYQFKDGETHSDVKMLDNYREGEIFDSVTNKTYVWRAEHPMIPDPNKPETKKHDCLCRDCEYYPEAMAYLRNIGAKEISVFCPMFRTHCNWILMRNIEDHRGALVPVSLNLKSSKAADVLDELFD